MAEDQTDRTENLTPAQKRTSALESPTEAEYLERQRQRFRGTYCHSLDSKGRMVVPLAFREGLGENFVIAPEFDFKSIAVYPEKAFLRMCERYERMGRRRKNQHLMDYMQWINALSFTGQECDSQGRILLPQKLRSVMLGEEKDVDIMGNDDHLRVAASSRSLNNLMSFIADLPTTMDQISQLSDEENEDF